MRDQAPRHAPATDAEVITRSDLDPVALCDARARAVAEAVAAVRVALGDSDATPRTLLLVLRALRALAARPGLFEAASFPAPRPPGAARRHTLHRDDDGGLSLYLNTLAPGIDTAPHDHATWAAVAAVSGRERNRLYRRDGAMLRLRGEVVVRPGHGLALMPRDVHSIHTDPGAAPARMLHLYGRALERQHGRQRFDPAAVAIPDPAA